MVSVKWMPFRTMKIGWIGLLITLLAVVLVLLSPLFTTRYTDWWGVREDETVNVTKYWPIASSNADRFGGTPINHSIAFRISPSAFSITTDRIYVATGSKLFALDPGHGTSEWSSPINFGSVITTDPVVVNFGSIVSAMDADFWLYLGTVSGAVYAIHDDAASGGTPPTPIQIGTLDGAATGIAVFSGDFYEGRTPYDLVAAGSSEGTIYFWKANETGHDGPHSLSVGSVPVHIAAGPMIGRGSYPLFSPAFFYNSTNQTRPFFYAGGGDGYLSAINITDLSNPHLAWRKQVLQEAASWSTPPVVRLRSDISNRSPVVFSATDDGRFWAVFANNGTLIPSLDGPVRIGRPNEQPDDGVLTQPFIEIDRMNMYVGSSTGYAYSLKYDPASNAGEPFQLNWYFRDLFNPEGSTYIAASPISYLATLVFVSSNHDLGAPGPSPEDIGTLFALHSNDGSRAWYVSFNSAIVQPVYAVESVPDGLARVFVGTVGGSVYAYSTDGSLTWGSTLTCPDGSKISRGSTCSSQKIPVLAIALPLLIAGPAIMVYAALGEGKKPAKRNDAEIPGK